MNLLKLLAYPLSLSMSATSFAMVPYLGLHLGSNFFSEAQRIGALGVTGEIKRRQAIDGVEGVLTGGLRVINKPTYLLDTELFAGYNIDEMSVKNTLTGPPFVYDLKQNLNYSFGVRVLPAYIIQPNVSLFGLFGYINTELHSTSSDGVTEGLSGNQSTHFNGLQYGFGINIDLKQGVRLRIQDSYAFYAARTITTASTGLSGLPITVKINPYANQVSIGLVKEFS